MTKYGDYGNYDKTGSDGSGRLATLVARSVENV